MPTPDDLLLLEGTTVVGVLCNSGVVLAADSRVTRELSDKVSRKFVSDEAMKICKISDRIICARSGRVKHSSELYNQLKEMFKKAREEGRKDVSIGDLADYGASYLERLEREGNGEKLPIFSLLLAGTDLIKNQYIPRIYVISSVIKKRKLKVDDYHCRGSGRSFAHRAIINSTIKYEPSMSIQSAVELARRGVYCGSKHDPLTGGSVHVWSVEDDTITVVPKKDMYSLNKQYQYTTLKERKHLCMASRCDCGECNPTTDWDAALRMNTGAGIFENCKSW